MKDERVRLSRLTQHILWSAIGIPGIIFVLSDGAAIYFTDVYLMFGGVLYSSLTTYGVVSLIGDIRKGKTRKGIITEIKNTFYKAVK